MEDSNNQQSVNRWLKYGGIFFVCLSAGGLGFGIFSWHSGSCFLAVGLFQLLFAPEHVGDERVAQLKLRAITVGYLTGLSSLVLYEFVATFRPRASALPPLKAFDGFIVATGLALALFYYWRWQDGRPQGTE
jgi:hypothetical protein